MNDPREIRRKEKDSHNLHRTFLSQTNEFTSKKSELKGDAKLITDNLREFNELNRCYKWLELHNMNIQMKFHEGKPPLSPGKYKYSDTL